MAEFVVKLEVNICQNYLVHADSEEEAVVTVKSEYENGYLSPEDDPDDKDFSALLVRKGEFEDHKSMQDVYAFGYDEDKQQFVNEIYEGDANGISTEDES